MSVARLAPRNALAPEAIETGSEPTFILTENHMNDKLVTDVHTKPTDNKGGKYTTVTEMKHMDASGANEVSCREE